MRPILLALLAGAALAAWRRPGVARITRISRVVVDLDRAAAFYCDGLGFRRIVHGPIDPAILSLWGQAAGTETVLRLGEEELALVEFDPPGPAYPEDSRSDDTWFQHVAIVVDDMGAAFERLSRQASRPISTAGPERLPPSSGGAVAYKARDPDGHPLELIQFPAGQGRPTWSRRAGGLCLGIDHSALSVGSTRRSLRYYRRLGFHVAAGSFNEGPEQSRLDAIPNARARIVGLRPASQTGPGLELLGYDPPGRPTPPHGANAIVTDWITATTHALPQGQARAVLDPDGHRLLLLGIKAQPPRHAAR